MFDYHVHTSLCNHATGTMEQYVRAAVAKGLATICFLDHLTFQEAGRANAMFPREVPIYVDVARRLARQYRERISVRVGLEIDFSLGSMAATDPVSVSSPRASRKSPRSPACLMSNRTSYMTRRKQSW